MDNKFRLKIILIYINENILSNNEKDDTEDTQRWAIIKNSLS